MVQTDHVTCILASDWSFIIIIIRLVVPIDGKIGGEKDRPVSRCQYCGAVSEMVYNCNSLQCNKIFVSCTQCAADNLGCCSETCRTVTSAGNTGL